MKASRRNVLKSIVGTGAAGVLSPARDLLATSFLSWDFPSPRVPVSSSGRQLAWVLKHINSRAVDLSVRDLESHFTQDFLTAIAPDELLAIFTTYFAPNAPMSVARIEGPAKEDYIQAILTTPGADWRVTLGVDLSDANRMDSLFLTPVALPSSPEPAISTWTALKTKLKSIAPYVSFLTAELVHGELLPIAEYRSDRVLAIGSNFKLYVLAELMRQIYAGSIEWDELLSIRDDLRSLPNGDMRLELSGAAFPVRHFAEAMISASDNTATDHLISRIGREEVESAFARFGNSNPSRNIPLLLTREWFAIKLRLSKEEIEQYIEAEVDEKRALLENRVDPEALTLSEMEDWPGSYFIDSIEWFASAGDLCTVMASIHEMSSRFGLEPARDALSINPGIAFDARSWAYVGYKGGYETGVKSDVWLLERGDGRFFQVSAIINDRKKEIDGIGLSQLMSAAVDLLAKHD